MRNASICTAAIFALTLTAPAFAAPSPEMRKAGGDPQTKGQSTAIPQPPPPPPVGLCKTDAKLKEQCTVKWNKCVGHVPPTAVPNASCKAEWRKCCEPVSPYGGVTHRRQHG